MRLMLYAIFFWLICLYSCTQQKKDVIKIQLFNTTNHEFYQSASVQLLTPHKLTDIDTEMYKYARYFGLYRDKKIGYIVTNIGDTTTLFCSPKDYLDYSFTLLRDSTFNPDITKNNFWLGIDFNFMSLYEMDSITQKILHNLDGIHYYSSNGGEKFIPLHKPLFECHYYFDGKKVAKEDSFYYIKMNLIPEPKIIGR